MPSHTQRCSLGGQPGLSLELFDNSDLSGAPASTRNDRHISVGAPLDLAVMASGDFDFSVFAVAPQPISARWTGFYTPKSAGPHDIFVQQNGFMDSGYRLYLDGKLVADSWKMSKAVIEQQSVSLDASPHKIMLEYHGVKSPLGGPFMKMGIVRQGSWVDSAAEELAAKADAVVLAVGFDPSSETEGWDRTFRLPPGQDELIQRIAAANKNTVVVVTSGGAVDMNGWIERVPGIIEAWYPGQEGGMALAEFLFGDVNPSGRLPATFDTTQAQSSGARNRVSSTSSLDARPNRLNCAASYPCIDKEGKRGRG